MKNQVWRWVLGLIYILAVGAIWIAASFVVQSVINDGVSPFLVTYICDSLFVLLIPLIEIVRYLEDNYGRWLFWRNREDTNLQESSTTEEAVLLEDDKAGAQAQGSRSDVVVLKENDFDNHQEGKAILEQHGVPEFVGSTGLDAKGRWTRRRMAKVSLLISPFWFLAQLTFNLSLKYTTVTVRI